MYGRLALDLVQIYYDHSHWKNLNNAYDEHRFSPLLPIDVSTFYDVITRCRLKIVLFGVRVTWCVSAYNEDDLAGESRNMPFWCLQRGYAYIQCPYYKY